jgi:hypothetical protein
MKAATASCLALSNGGLFLFRSSPRPRRIFMHNYWRAERGMRLRLTVPTRRLGPPRAHAGQSTTGQAPDNASFQGKLAPGWPTNRRDICNAAHILLPGQMESVPVSALAGSCRGCRDHLADDYGAARFDRPGASLPNKGTLVFATIRCAIKTLIKTSWVCRRSLALGQKVMRMLRIHAWL